MAGSRYFLIAALGVALAGCTAQSGALCGASSDCGQGEACFAGVCTPTAATPGTLHLPEAGLVDVDFTGNTLPAGVTFGRATPASTSVDGRLLLAAAGDPRLEVDQRFALPRGLLVEPAVDNICFESENLTDTTYWWVNRIERSVAQVAAPDGSSTAVRLTPSVTFEYHSIGQGFTAQNDVVYTYSLFLKAGELDSIYIGIGNSSDYPNQLLDLRTGTLSQINMQNAIIDAGATPAGDGWYRAWLTFTNHNLGAALNVMLDLGQLDADPTRGLYAWGCQLEVGQVPTSFLPAATTAAQRGDDRVVLESPGAVDLGQDFTLAVVQSVDVSARAAAVGVAVQPSGQARELVLGQRDAGNAWLAIFENGVVKLNIGAGETWRDGEQHVVAVSKHGRDYTLADNGAVTTGVWDGLDSGTVPAAVVRLGQRLAGGSAPTHVRRFVAWQRAFDVAELVALTTP